MQALKQCPTFVDARVAMGAAYVVLPAICTNHVCLIGLFSNWY
ncbi:MAG: hypothetical protein ACK56I_32365, partial [bacterium]